MIIIYTTSAVLMLIAGIHVYWAFGGVAFIDSVIPTKTDGDRLFSPGRWATLAVALFMTLGAATLVMHNLSPTKTSLTATIIYSVVFFLRGVGDFRYVGISKRVTQTDFAIMDTILFTPLVFIISFIFVFSLTV